MLSEILISLAAGVMSATVVGFVGKDLQRRSVDRGWKRRHFIGGLVFLQAPNAGAVGYYWAGVTLPGSPYLDLMLIMWGVLVYIALRGHASQRDYHEARALRHVYPDDLNHWTDAWARGERADEWLWTTAGGGA